MRNVIGRRTTRLQICANHAGWFAAVVRHRAVETFDEGGPAAGIACDRNRPCRIWPGLDFFVPSVCNAEADWPANWGVNREPDPC